MKGLYVIFVFASFSLSLCVGIEVINQGASGDVEVLNYNVLDYAAKVDGETDDSDVCNFYYCHIFLHGIIP